MIPAFILALLFFLLAIGTPVAFAMAFSGGLGLYLTGGLLILLGVLQTTPLSAVTSYELITIPMFLLMADLVLLSGVADDLFKTAAAWVGRIPGGLRHGDRIGRRGLRLDLRHQHGLRSNAVLDQLARNDPPGLRAEDGGRRRRDLGHARQCCCRPRWRWSSSACWPR